MANTLTNTTDTIIANAAVDAFTAALLPLTAFSNNLSAEAVKRGDKVKVLYVPAQDAATDFAGTYDTQDADATGVDVSINKHKFVSWGLSDTEIATMPQLALEAFGKQKGFQLAKAVLVDILSLVTNANYGAAVFTGAASTFDSDDVVDIGAACDAADWADEGRSLILSGSYHAALRKSAALKDASAFGGSEAIRMGTIPSLDTFGKVFKSTIIPANAENLVGFAAHSSAMAVAMRYLQPQEGNSYFQAGAITDPETGFTLGFRDWYDNDTGTRKKVLEANYGYVKLNGSAIKRMVSA